MVCHMYAYRDSLSDDAGNDHSKDVEILNTRKGTDCSP
jgi:hypothetical protein